MLVTWKMCEFDCKWQNLHSFWDIDAEAKVHNAAEIKHYTILSYYSTKLKVMYFIQGDTVTKVNYRHMDGYWKPQE